MPWFLSEPTSASINSETRSRVPCAVSSRSETPSDSTAVSGSTKTLPLPDTLTLSTSVDSPVIVGASVLSLLLASSPPHAAIQIAIIPATAASPTIVLRFVISVPP